MKLGRYSTKSKKNAPLLSACIVNILNVIVNLYSFIKEVNLQEYYEIHALDYSDFPR